MGKMKGYREMKGNKCIAQILKDDYNINDLTPYEEIEYEIEHYTKEISRVKIQSKTGRCFCCPVYAMFDGYHMSWYGDYGFWGFSCTWQTNITNLAYNSPYYQLEKLVSRERAEFNAELCEKEFLKLIKESDWYTYDLTEEQKESFDKFILEAYTSYVDDEDCLYEIAEICEDLKTLKEATQSEYDWIFCLNKSDFSEHDYYSIFGCGEYELYDIGKQAPGNFFIILYMLSVVANTEKSLSAHPTEKGGAE